MHVIYYKGTNNKIILSFKSQQRKTNLKEELDNFHGNFAYIFQALLKSKTREGGGGGDKYKIKVNFN